jgi:ABC-type oligopeptide transport system ATPase subunit
MARLELRTVRKSYGAVDVIKGVDLHVEQGEFCVFVGPSGCGKSTLLRMIAGLEPITGGEIAIANEVVNAIPAADRGLAMVFQSYALYPHMSARAPGLPLRRALVEPRRGAARRHAGRDQRAAQAPRQHHGLRHPRPGGGDDDGRQDRRPAAWGARTVRPPARPLQRARESLRGRLHRQPEDEFPQGHRGRRPDAADPRHRRPRLPARHGFRPATGPEGHPRPPPQRPPSRPGRRAPRRYPRHRATGIGKLPLRPFRRRHAAHGAQPRPDPACSPATA